MNKFLGLALITFLLLVLGANVFACNISVSNFSTDLRPENTDSYYSSISSAKNNDIDVKIEFIVDAHSGNDCPTNISAQAIIYRYNTNNSTWESFRTTSAKTQELSNDSYIFVWSNEFNTGSNSTYTRYRVDGVILNGSTELQKREAYIDIIDNSCTGIRLTTSTINVDEGRSASKAFAIENNTDYDFRITNARAYFVNSIIRNARVDYDTIVPSRSTRNITVLVDVGTVSFTTTTTGTLAVNGTLNSNTCSTTDVGTKLFDIVIRDTGTNTTTNYDNYYDSYYDNYYNSTSSECGDIRLESKTIYADEATNSKPVFAIQNLSTKRFEVLEVSTTTNGIIATPHTNDQYIFPGQVGNVILNLTTPSVTTETAYTNSVKVRGRFADGRTCEFRDINSTYLVNVLNQSNYIETDCRGLNISAPNTFNVENYGVMPFSIQNLTNKTATVFIEGTVDASPTLVTLPSGATVSRDLTILMQSATGQVSFRPVVDGCSIPSKFVSLTNSAKGEVKNIKMTVITESDTNSSGLMLTIELNNPTTRAFNGTLEVTAVGFNDSKQNIGISPGLNHASVVLAQNGQLTNGKGKAVFYFEGQKIEAEFSTGNNSSLAGLFSLGAENESIGLILLVAIAVVILVGIVSARGNVKAERDSGQRWAK